MAKLAALLVVAACGTTEVRGTAMLDVQPIARPVFAGAYDFELLRAVRGTACVPRTASGARHVELWTGTFTFVQGPTDRLARLAIAEACSDAVDRVAGADTLLVTRVITDVGERGETCAWVYGRAVRITKAGAATPARPDDTADADADATDAIDATTARDAADPAPAGPGPIDRADDLPYDVFDRPRPPRPPVP